MCLPYLQKVALAYETARVKKRQDALYKIPVESWVGARWFWLHTCNILLCHFPDSWQPRSHGKPQLSQEVPEHPLILFQGARGAKWLWKVCVLWAQGCWGQGKLHSWQEDWILMCFRGPILYNYFLAEVLVLLGTLLCVPVNLRFAFDGECLLV